MLSLRAIRPTLAQPLPVSDELIQKSGMLDLLENDNATPVYVDKFKAVLLPMSSQRRQEVVSYVTSKLAIEQAPDRQGRPQPVDLYHLRKLTETVSELHELLPDSENFEKTADEMIRFRPTLTACDLTHKTSREVERSHMICNYRDPGVSLKASFKQMQSFCTALTKHMPLEAVETLYDTVGRNRDQLQALLPGVATYAELFSSITGLLQAEGMNALPPQQLAEWLPLAMEERADGETLQQSCGRLANFHWLSGDLDQRRPFMERLSQFLQQDAEPGTRMCDLQDSLDAYVETRRLLGTRPSEPLDTAFRAATAAHRRNRVASLGASEDGWLTVGEVRVPVKPRVTPS